MDSNLVQQITVELINFQAPDVETILTGVDQEVPYTHIYLIKNGDISCQDTIGFAAIGIGSWHANSQLMFAGHTRWKSFPETLLLVYSAKKRAEVAPGVGEATDMITIGPALGQYSKIDVGHISALEIIYKTSQKEEQAAAIRAKESAKTYVEEISKAAIAKEEQAISPDTSRDAPPNEKDPSTASTGERAKTD